LLFISPLIHAVELTGALWTHDPSRIMKDSTRYWFYSTGNGVPASFSDNLSSWNGSAITVFPVGTWPGWINTTVPGFGGHFWAPDLIYMNNAYYLYYSCSTFGSSRSAIGVAWSPSLNEPEWTDLGMVVSSNGTSTAINAIDPGLFKDDDGKVYMVYGSWFGGIGIVEIDTVTGLATTTTTHLYGGSHQSIEAANLIKEGSYYYLIVNRGNCCQGINSTYYITVGRSENILGPYEGFGTILSTDGKYVGPGHFGPLYDSCATYVSIHYYDKTAGGAAKLDILKMTFYEGWPELTRDFTFENCGATSIKDYSKDGNDPSLYVFPNPAENCQFTLSLPGEFKEETVTVGIYGLDGKQLFHEVYTGVQTICPNISPGKGIYIVEVKNSRRFYTQRLIIQ
jgi:arabinan endo-1,5-alpha-L-arabinosidase